MKRTSKWQMFFKRMPLGKIFEIRIAQHIAKCGCEPKVIFIGPDDFALFRARAAVGKEQFVLGLGNPPKLFWRGIELIKLEEKHEVPTS
jgi:hypothetical protein